MDLNIAGQYKYITKEQERIKKMIEKNDQRLELLGKQLRHANDIQIARKQIKKKELISQEELFNELGL